MRVGAFEISLVGVNDESVLDETKLADGKTYFYAQPGQYFRVRVSVSHEKDRSLPERMLIFLSLDGRDLGYSKRLSRRFSTAFFDGFSKDNQRFDFQFSSTVLAPEHELSRSLSTSSLVAGCISVSVFAAFEDKKNVRIHGKGNNSNAQGLPSGALSVNKDGKFWAQPSVTTACRAEGRLLPTVFKRGRRWCKASAQPLLTCTAYYHTTGVLHVLREILQVEKTGEEEKETVKEEEKEMERETRKRERARETVIDLSLDDNDNNDKEKSSTNNMGNNTSQQMFRQKRRCGSSLSSSSSSFPSLSFPSASHTQTVPLSRPHSESRVIVVDLTAD